MPRIPFTSDPAWASVGDGISLAFAHWRATALWWLIPVLVMGILSMGLNAWAVSTVQDLSPTTYLREAEIDWGGLLGRLLPQLALTVGVLTVIEVVIRWVYLGLLITGLRGGELHAGWVLNRGVRTLAADILIGIVLAATVAVGALLIAVAKGVGVLLVLGIAIAWIGLVLRLAFWQTAIFDGAGVREGFSRTLRLTSGAWLRVLGWLLAAALLGALASIPIGILTAVLSSLPAIAAGLRTGFQEAFAVFQVFMLGVLYESQRRRRMPAADEPPVAYRPVLAGPTWGTASTTPSEAPVDPLGRPWVPSPDPAPPVDAPVEPDPTPTQPPPRPRDPWRQ